MTTWRSSSTATGERPAQWQDLAACRNAVARGIVTGPDNDPFFPGDNKTLAATALSYCRVCPVVAHCEMEYRNTRIGHGVWGGRHRENRPIVRNAPNTTPAGAERYTLWEQGLNDRQIADRTGTKPETVTNWRRYHKLPGNIGCGDMGRREELHAQGLCDREIAEIEGTQRSIIAAWRTRNNLRLNPDPNGTIPINPYKSTRDRAAERTASRAERYAKGWTDQEIAEAEGVPKGNIKSWRQRRGMPANKAAS